MPKPLLRIGKKPIAERIIEKLLPVKQIDTIYIVTNARFADQFSDWAKTYKCGCRIEIINDGTLSNEDRLGAVGDINYVINTAKINDDLLIVAGDNLIDFEVNNFVKFSDKNGSCIALKDMAGTDPKLISQYSIVALDDNRRLIDFEEKPPNPKTSLISICMYLFRKNHLKLLKKYLELSKNPDAPGYYIQWLHKEIDLYGYIISGMWYDIGDIDSYTKACENLEGKC